MRVDKPELGRVITEADPGSSLVTTFTVIPSADICRVLIASSWDGAAGIGVSSSDSLPLV
ncbi:MAG: hypothetical protein M3070_09280 [Actinomycetota bacterium]|nr:hypothetical protein [Actinomycetota bacterium]